MRTLKNDGRKIDWLLALLLMINKKVMDDNQCVPYQ